MNILVLSNSPLLEYQGSGYVIVNTIRALENLGHNVTAIPPSQLEVIQSLKHRAVIYRKATGIALWLLKNKKLLNQYQLIIFYGAESSLGLFFLKRFLNKRVKTILHSNGIEQHVDFRLKTFREYIPYHKNWYSINDKYLYTYCYKNVDSIITVSEYDKKFAVDKLGLPADKIFVDEPMLPRIFFENIGNEQVKKESIITYCGSWIARKGVEYIKQAIPDILRDYPQYKLRLIGVGDDFKIDSNFSADLISRIEIFPTVKDKRHLIKLYKESDIFLFPSFCESFGLVVAEAMLCNCAVVTGPTGFAADLTNKVDAIVLPIPDKKSIQEALRTLLTDTKFKEKLQNNAPSKVCNLTITNYTSKLKSIIESICFTTNI